MANTITKQDAERIARAMNYFGDSYGTRETWTGDEVRDELLDGNSEVFDEAYQALALLVDHSDRPEIIKKAYSLLDKLDRL